MNLFNFKTVSWRDIQEGQNLSLEIEDDHSKMSRSLKVSFEGRGAVGHGHFRTQSEFGTIKQYGLFMISPEGIVLNMKCEKIGVLVKAIML